MAVHVLTMLASAGEGRVKSERIAGSVNTNAVVVRRLISQLSQAKLVSTHAGASGGTSLARAAGEINLAEVYQAVCCGEVFALHARSPNQDCPVGRNIEAVLCNLQKEIDRSVNEKLAQYTLADIMARVEEGSS